jgi:hypothetical protein
MRTRDVKIATPLKDAGSNFDPLRVVPLSPAGRTRNLVARVERGLFKAGPRVRIHFPPAESQSLARIRFRKSRTPAFRAGVRGWLGDPVGRDAPGVSISRQPAAISLSGHIPVPQCADGVGDNAALIPRKSGVPRLIVRLDL